MRRNSNLSEDSVDRAHRIGHKIVSENGTVRQQMIVKFKNFSDRTKFYRSRKKTKKVSIRLDLTKKRLTLLNVARDKIKDKEGVDFAFADINCNSGCHLEIFLFSELKLNLIAYFRKSDSMLLFYFSSCKPASSGGAM